MQNEQKIRNQKMKEQLESLQKQFPYFTLAINNINQKQILNDLVQVQKKNNCELKVDTKKHKKEEKNWDLEQYEKDFQNFELSRKFKPILIKENKYQEQREKRLMDEKKVQGFKLPRKRNQRFVLENIPQDQNLKDECDLCEKILQDYPRKVGIEENIFQEGQIKNISYEYYDKENDQSKENKGINKQKNLSCFFEVSKNEENNYFITQPDEEEQDEEYKMKLFKNNVFGAIQTRSIIQKIEKSKNIKKSLTPNHIREKNQDKVDLGKGLKELAQWKNSIRDSQTKQNKLRSANSFILSNINNVPVKSVEELIEKYDYRQEMLDQNQRQVLESVKSQLEKREEQIRIRKQILKELQDQQQRKREQKLLQKKMDLQKKLLDQSSENYSPAKKKFLLNKLQKSPINQENQQQQQQQNQEQNENEQNQNEQNQNQPQSKFFSMAKRQSKTPQPQKNLIHLIMENIDQSQDKNLSALKYLELTDKIQKKNNNGKIKQRRANLSFQNIAGKQINTISDIDEENKLSKDINFQHYLKKSKKFDKICQNIFQQSLKINLFNREVNQSFEETRQKIENKQIQIMKEYNEINAPERVRNRLKYKFQSMLKIYQFDEEK